MNKGSRVSALRGDAGRSLIEVFICLAVIALLLVSVMRAVQEFNARQRVHAVAAAVYVDLQQARSEAVRTATTVHVSFVQHASGSCYWMHSGKTDACSCNADGQTVCQDSGTLIKAQWLPLPLSPQVKANVRRMTFQGHQGTVSTTGSIDIQLAHSPSIRHVVSIAGRVRTCSPDAARGALPSCG
ncbi:GspH/FimT family pseudopilin [Paucibacter sediminis]|uniref:Type II secretion system protein H n=1 Tax=Paucibacter sediminis TaxID=3019553 RepID=A0AA95NBJ8_9BURK|nr:GspH/FimT family pseudopilin [Paucibacter sp. S2-9]WIT11019.1 GspH/FimT family pseudopilin [Paucibacter sp. S2-9]